MLSIAHFRHKFHPTHNTTTRPETDLSTTVLKALLRHNSEFILTVFEICESLQNGSNEAKSK